VASSFVVAGAGLVLVSSPPLLSRGRRLSVQFKGMIGGAGK
jgi:hypothetical protein